MEWKAQGLAMPLHFNHSRNLFTFKESHPPLPREMAYGAQQRPFPPDLDLVLTWYGGLFFSFPGRDQCQELRCQTQGYDLSLDAHQMFVYIRKRLEWNMAIENNKKKVPGKGQPPLWGDFNNSKMQNLLDEAEEIWTVWKKKTRV